MVNGRALLETVPLPRSKSLYYVLVAIKMLVFFFLEHCDHNPTGGGQRNANHCIMAPWTGCNAQGILTLCPMAVVFAIKAAAWWAFNAQLCLGLFRMGTLLPGKTKFNNNNTTTYKGTDCENLSVTVTARARDKNTERERETRGLLF